ncbi:MAG TPA: flagellar motor protein MotB [Steroidobacteraceae bacterium]
MLNKPEKAGEAIIRRVSRKKHEEGHGGSAWKVAFADFCLALLALFLVLWLLATREQEHLQDLLERAGGKVIDEGRGHMVDSEGGPRGSLISREPMPSNGDQVAKRSLASGDDAPAGPGSGIRLSKTLFESHADMAELAQAVHGLGEEAGLGGNVRSLITPYGLRVLLHDTDRQGMFQRGSSVPSERFRELLHKLGPLFDQIDNQMVIVGHTDSLQYANHGPTSMSNWQLSSERAMSARSYLLEGGMPANSVLQVVGLADSAPLNSKDPAADENRRIELLILTKVQAHNINAMFGAPDETEPLIDGVDTSVPSQETLEALRSQLTPKAR